MKKLLFLSIVLAGCIQANAKIVIVECKNTKGECGYKVLRESHDRGVDALSCREPGDLACRFQQPITQTPPIVVSLDGVNAALTNIEYMIDIETSDGNPSGSFSSEIGNVVWSQTEDGVRTIEIE